MSDLKSDHILDHVTVNDQNQAYSSWVPVDIHELLTIYAEIAILAGTPGNLTLTLEVSPQSAEKMNDAATPAAEQFTFVYDKLINNAGVDAPVASHVFSAAGKAMLSASAEDVIRSARVGYISAATTDGSNSWTLDVWLAAQVAGSRRG